MEELWIPIVLFIAIAIVMSVWLYFRYHARVALQKTVQTAIEKGHELSPELLASLGQPKISGHEDLRRGIIALAIGAAFVILAFMIPEPEALRPMLGAAAFPVMIGVAYLSLWAFAGNKDG